LPSEEGLRRNERIAQAFEYKEVIRKGRLIAGKTFNAYFLIGMGLDRKAGFIAGRRVGNACLRNRAKRLLRESYRISKAGLPASGFRAVFVAKDATAAAKLADVRNEMAWMFRQCGLVKSA
jgi:ribonuclease P protein component